MPGMLAAALQQDVDLGDAVTSRETQIVDRYLSFLRVDESVDADKVTFLEEQWAERRGPAGDEAANGADGFLIEAMSLVSPSFRAGLDAFDEGAYLRSAGVMNGLLESPDPFVATHARIYASKALVNAEDFEAAQPAIEAILAEADVVSRHSTLLADVAFLKGVCELGQLRYDAAADSLDSFMEAYPDAPRRLRMTAGQIAAELRQRVPGQLGDVSDLMDFSARRLGQDDIGEPVLQRQGQAVAMLDALIEEAEQQEQNQQGGGGGGSNDPSGGGSQGGGQGDVPLGDSMLPGGSSSASAPNRRKVAAPGAAWGGMKPAEREQIIQALDERFPDRYRQLVEQYYEQLAKEP